MLIVPMDATLIEQVLINLMENAIRHSGSTAPIGVKVSRKKAAQSLPYPTTARELIPPVSLIFLTEKPSMAQVILPEESALVYLSVNRLFLPMTVKFLQKII